TLHSLLRSFGGTTLTRGAPPACCRAPSLARQLALLAKIGQDGPDPVSAHARAGALQVCQPKLARLRADGLKHEFRLGPFRALHLSGPFLKLPVGPPHDGQEVV